MIGIHRALKEAGWSVAQTQYVFTPGLVSFAIVMILAGRLMPRFGPRKLAIAGGIVLGAGYVLASFQGEPSSGWSVWVLVSSVAPV